MWQALGIESPSRVAGPAWAGHLSRGADSGYDGGMACSGGVTGWRILD